MIKKLNDFLKKIDEAIYVTSLIFAVIITCISIIFIFTHKVNAGFIGSYTLVKPRRQSSILGAIDTYVTVTTCGNGAIEEYEECDGTNLGGHSCVTLGYDTGTLSCNGNCTFNTSECTTAQPACGNGVRQDEEECDKNDLGGYSCSTFGYTGGTLSCYSNCTFNKSSCFITTQQIIPPTQPVQPPPPKQETEEESKENGEDKLLVDYIEYLGVRYRYDNVPEIEHSDSFTVYGSTTPFALVRIVIEGTTQVYETQADENGTWSITINTEGLDKGEYKLNIEVTSDGKTEVIDTLTFEITPPRTVIEITLPFTGEKPKTLEIPRWLVIAFAAGISLGTSFFIILKVRRMNKEQKVK
ncbi:hypothetical protein JW766_03485 [Candidatus Dojkabacteria bacterium]|nr:hypothetical protein [Candidatus Dojkabacteria bacterium]